MEILYYPLDEIQKEFLKYAPAYAQIEAQAAITKIMDLKKQRVIEDGLYYIVLVDLVGSTNYSTTHGNKKLANRIQHFVTSSFDAYNEANTKNIGLFIKEIGDAVLYIFHHFPDILHWRAMFDKRLSLHSKNDAPFLTRTCVHIGEVFLQGVNPLSLAVSQIFKMEKSVEANKIVLTQSAYSVAWPTIARAYHGFKRYKTIKLDGYTENVQLYELQIHDEEDLERIVKEQLE